MFFNRIGHNKPTERKSIFIIRKRLYNKLIKLVEKAISSELGVGLRDADTWEFKLLLIS